MSCQARFPFIRIISFRKWGRRVRAGGTAIAFLLAIPLLVVLAPISQGAPTPEGGADYSPTGSCNLPGPPNTLWILASQCCKAQPPTANNCEDYSSKYEYVVVKDLATKPWGHLIIPTVKVTGIEDTKNTEAIPVLDFWEFGWDEATKRLKKKPEHTALAINSKPGRDQNQLHIHMSCVHESVANKLEDADNKHKIDSNPKNAFTMKLGQHDNLYEVVKVKSLAGSSSPFKLVMQFPNVNLNDIANQSIAIVGSKTTGIYYMLVTHHVAGGNPGTAEELLNQTDTCKNVD